MDSILIGKFISEMRKKRGLTQAELASMLNVTSQAVSKWENGRGIPDIEMLKKLSEIFDVHVDEILNGKLNRKSKKNYFSYFFFSFIVLLFIIGFVFLLPRQDDFSFSKLASDNDAFSIRGVIAYNKNKKSIYISEVHYDKEDPSQYREIECILYEKTDHVERLIGKWGEIKGTEDKLYYLTELLKGIEFNIDPYLCDCDSPTCNLYLRINALDHDDKIITYQIPIQIEPSCQE